MVSLSFKTNHIWKLNNDRWHTLRTASDNTLLQLYEPRKSFICQNSAQLEFSSGHLNNTSDEDFYIMGWCPPPHGHCPSHFIIPRDPQLHFIIHHRHLAHSGHSISHFITSCIFVNSQLWYRIWLSCLLFIILRSKINKSNVTVT